MAVRKAPCVDIAVNKATRLATGTSILQIYFFLTRYGFKELTFRLPVSGMASDISGG